MPRLHLTMPWAILIGAVLLAGAILFTATETTTLILGIFTIATTGGAALFAYLLWRSSRSIEWFTGAMESHSDLMLRMEVRAKGVKMVWWDKTIKPIPFSGKHSEEVTIEEIYISLPPRLRREQPSAWWKRFVGDR
jgi:hypothetical protein